MTFTDYLHQLAADLTESGFTETGRDLCDAANRLEAAHAALVRVAAIAEEYGNPSHRHVARIIDTAQTAAEQITHHGVR